MQFKTHGTAKLHGYMFMTWTVRARERKISDAHRRRDTCRRAERSSPQMRGSPGVSSAMIRSIHWVEEWGVVSAMIRYSTAVGGEQRKYKVGGHLCTM